MLNLFVGTAEVIVIVIGCVGPENMDALELDMRMRLAELQRRYKDKQRELSRLQPNKHRR